MKMKIGRGISLITSQPARCYCLLFWHIWHYVKGITMSISLPTNKEEKRQRLIMLVKQDSLTVIQANKLFTDYCRLYDKVKK